MLGEPDELQGLARTWVPSLDGRPGAVRLSLKVVGILSDDRSPQQAGKVIDPLAAEMRQWSAYHAALLADPEATCGAS